jgi:hypothetical protein
MKARKIWSLAWVLAVLVAGLYGLGKLSLWLYGPGKFDSQVRYTETSSQSTIRSHFFRRAIVVKTIPPQPVLKKAKSAEGLSLAGILKKVTVHHHPQTGGYKLRQNGLHLVVQNGSDYEIAQVQVQVEHLSENGAVLSADVVPIDQLRPQSRLLVRVPAPSKTHRIRLSVLNIYMPVYSSAEKFI